MPASTRLIRRTAPALLALAGAVVLPMLASAAEPAAPSPAPAATAAPSASAEALPSVEGRLETQLAQAEKEQERRAAAARADVAKLNPEQIAAALQVLRANNPDLVERLTQAERENPEKINQLLSEAWPTLRPWVDLYKRDQALFGHRLDEMKLTRQADHTVQSLSAAKTPKEQLETRAKLKEVVAQRFEVRQQIRQRELELYVAGAERRAADLKRTIEDQEKNRDKIIDDELAKLLR